MQLQQPEFTRVNELWRRGARGQRIASMEQEIPKEL